MLKLCPNDNLGVRYLLVNELRKRGAHDEAGLLCRSYSDDSGIDLSYRAVPLLRMRRVLRMRGAAVLQPGVHLFVALEPQTRR